MHLGMSLGVSRGNVPFALSQLFAAGQKGGLWLPNDPLTGFQESTGVTAGAVNLPTGLRLDKRLGLVLGSELLESSSPSGTGWTDAVATPANTVSGDLLTFGGQYSGRINAATTEANKTYEFKFTARRISGNTALHIFYENSASGTGLTAFTISGTAAQYTVRVLGKAGGGIVNFGIQDRNAAGHGQIEINAFSVKLLDGNHVLQSTAAARPTWKLDGAIYSDLFDGTDDGYATAAFAAGTLTSDMDCFIAVKRNSAADVVLCSKDGNYYFGFASSGGVGAPQALSGTPSYLVDGAAITATNGALHTALTVGAWHILEVRNLDLSAWTAFRLSLYAGYFLNGNIGGVILREVMSTAERNSARTALGSLVGLSL